MTRFDFLRDGERAVPEALRSLLASRAVRAPLLCAAVIALALAIAAVAETYATDAASRAAEKDRARYAAVRAAGDAAEREERQALRRSEAADRVRWLRGSGTRIARGLAGIANALPARAWLTAIDRVPGGGYVLSGATADADAIAELFSTFAADAPVLDRVDGAQGSQPARFTFTIEKAP